MFCVTENKDNSPFEKIFLLRAVFIVKVMYTITVEEKSIDLERFHFDN